MNHDALLHHSIIPSLLGTDYNIYQLIASIFVCVHVWIEWALISVNKWERNTYSLLAHAQSMGQPAYIGGPEKWDWTTLFDIHAG